MARRRRRGGRTTPKGTRPPHLRSVPDHSIPDHSIPDHAGPDPDVAPDVDNMIDLGADDLLDEDNPAAAEAWASHLLAMFDSVRRAARLDHLEAPPFEEVMLERCRQRSDENALVVAVALASVVPPALHDAARRTVAELRQVATGPPWLDDVGRAEPTRAWLVSDVFGDQDALIVAFADPGSGPDPDRAAAGEHALVVLVDHNLSGQAKDAWIGEDADDIVAAWSSSDDPGLRIDPVPPDAALSRLRDAMAMSDLWNGDVELRSDDFADNRALVWARLRRAGLEEPRDPSDVGPPEMPPEERDALVADFLASAHAAACRAAGVHAADVAVVAHSIVALRCDYEGRPLRWSPAVVGLLLTDLAPRKLLLEPGQMAALPAVVRAFVTYAGERTGLPERFVAEILEAVDEAEPEYLDGMGDPGAAGPAKAAMAALRAAGVDLDDPEALADALEDLGPLPLPPIGYGAPATRRPKPADAPTDVVAAMGSTTVLTRFALLVDFYGEGRKLTATGQPTLADARTLVGLLGTEDRLDEKFGDKVFRTTTAADLPELGFAIRWAVAAGALRKEKGRLRSTAAWRKLDDKPVARWLKAADALAKLGPLATLHGRARAGFRQMAEFVDDEVPGLLHSLLAGPMPFDTAVEVLCAEADAAFEWSGGYMADPVARRRSFGYDLESLLRVMGWAGILERADFSLEPDRWDPSRTNKVGGTIEMTPLGRWWVAGAL